jgi:hypothetical protein
MFLTRHYTDLSYHCIQWLTDHYQSHENILHSHPFLSNSPSRHIKKSCTVFKDTDTMQINFDYYKSVIQTLNKSLMTHVQTYEELPVSISNWFLQDLKISTGFVSYDTFLSSSTCGNEIKFYQSRVPTVQGYSSNKDTKTCDVSVKFHLPDCITE